MSFTTHVNKALDPSLPTGLRLRCLCEAVERFRLFRFQATFERLRAITGVTGRRWTAEQVGHAARLLADAHAAWAAYADEAHAAARLAKKAKRFPPQPGVEELLARWREEWLASERGRVWRG